MRQKPWRMWLFKREILGSILPQDNDMPFSQEIKIHAACNPRIRFAEFHIPYHTRVGTSKLIPLRHGIKNLSALVVLKVKMLF